MTPALQFEHLCVVLVNTRNPLNIGAAARAMSNFDFADLRVVNPYDPSFREARSAVGASGVLRTAREYKSVAEAVADCNLVVGTTSAARRELQHRLRRLDAGAQIIRKRLTRERVALLFGSEKRGLSNDDLSHCHWLVRIPTREEHGSMNLGQAVAICLYELARGGKPAQSARKKPAEKKPPKEAKAASAGDLERISTLLLETLRSSGYLDSRSGASADEKIRRMVLRLNLSAADAELWLGMLRQMGWKMGRDREIAT
ncbi:MAG TPA: RNA methyltransferase [Candidatus Angelobacter sp.]